MPDQHGPPLNNICNDKGKKTRRRTRRDTLYRYVWLDSVFAVAPPPLIFARLFLFATIISSGHRPRVLTERHLSLTRSVFFLHFLFPLFSSRFVFPARDGTVFRPFVKRTTHTARRIGQYEQVIGKIFLVRLNRKRNCILGERTTVMQRCCIYSTRNISECFMKKNKNRIHLK